MTSSRKDCRALPVSLDDVRRAARRLDGVAHRTPVVTSQSLDARTAATVYLKAENLQRTGSFKFRGAYNAVAALPSASRQAGVTAASSGNHAQALALAAALHQTRATILMPHDVPPLKRRATLGYGAEIRGFDRYADDREARQSTLAREEGYQLIHPFEEPNVMAGGGTVALELLEQAFGLDTVVVCTSGGGLLSGCAVAVKEQRPDVRVVAVEPQHSAALTRARAHGRPTAGPVGATIADGQQLTCFGERTWPVASTYVDEVVTVTDDQIRVAMRLLFERCKLVVEPSGGSALAAVLAGLIDVRGQRVGVTLTGGNVDAQRFGALVRPSDRVASPRTATDAL